MSSSGQEGQFYSRFCKYLNHDCTYFYWMFIAGHFVLLEFREKEIVEDLVALSNKGEIIRGLKWM